LDPLSLRFIGWFFTLIPAVALLVGAVILMSLYRSGGLERRYAEQSVWNDLVLLTIWVAGLMGGIGVLLGQSWSRPLLEFFCWVLSALSLLSGATRLYSLKRANGSAPINWLSAIAGVLVVVAPIVALCAATILTLRGETARQVLGGY